MDKTDKKVILKEIDSWRTNRLLPAEYCDFLSNLYAEGETFSLDEKPKHTSRSLTVHVPWKRLSASLAVSWLLLLFVLHFTSFPSWMQIVILLLFTAAFYYLAFFVQLSVSMLRIVFLTSACLMVGVDGYYFWQAMGLQASLQGSLGVLVLVFLVWILSGAAGESRMIVSAAWIGIGVLYEMGVQFVRGEDWSHYTINTIYWAVFAAVSFGLAAFLGRSKIFVAPSWAVSGVLALLVPDFLYVLSGAKPSFLVDVTAFLKISLLITGIIVFREGIQKWLDSFTMRQYNKIE